MSTLDYKSILHKYITSELHGCNNISYNNFIIIKNGDSQI